MTKQEFTERTGLTVTNDEYVMIEELYYSADNMQKDQFCELYKQIHGNELFQILSGKLLTSRKANKIYQKEEDEMIEFLTIKAAEHDDDALEKKAREICPFGRKKTIQIKIDYALDLSSDDLSYIRENLR